MALCAQFPAPIQCPPGVYTVTTPGPTVVTYTATSVTISWAATPNPNPNPDPNPNPNPGPVPAVVPVITGHVWALAIYDPTAKLPVDQQAALTSQSLQTSAVYLDVHFESHTVSDNLISSYVSQVNSVGVPALLLIKKSDSGTGTVAYKCALPASESEIVALLKKIRGK